MKKKSNLKRLISFISPYKKGFLVALVLVLISAVTNALFPYITGLAITEISSNVVEITKGIAGATVNFPYVLNIIILILMVGVINGVSAYFSVYFITNVVQNSMEDLRGVITHKLNRLPVSYFDSHQQGDVLSRITNDVDALGNALQQSLIQMITAVLGIVFAVVMMFIISVEMALVALLIIPISIFVSRTIIKKSQPYFTLQQKKLGELNANVQESYTGFSVIKLYGKEKERIEQFKKTNDDLTKNSFKANFVSGMMMPLVGAVAEGGYIAMAVLGGWFTIIGRITLGNLQAFVQYIWQINQPLSQMTQLANALQSAGAGVKRIFEFLDEEEEPVEGKLPFSDDFDFNHIEVSFEDVYFSYSQDKPLIEDFSFHVNNGQTVAIVGPTGAGKTTLINLLMGFYRVDKGAIKINGINIDHLKSSDLRSLFGMVLQDAWLYNGSVADNIAFGKLDSTRQEIIEAAKVANVDHFIRTLQDGYDMVLNEEASNISLGEKQLLTIARAVIADPKILILDEATSSVDTRLEILIQKAMNKIRIGRTSFIIAHRLSTIREADLILVMNEGHIVEIGNHETLLTQKGFYEKLYNSQFKR